jgi:hypothetical protein
MGSGSEPLRDDWLTLTGRCKKRGRGGDEHPDKMTSPKRLMLVARVGTLKRLVKRLTDTSSLQGGRGLSYTFLMQRSRTFHTVRLWSNPFRATTRTANRCEKAGEA